METLELPLAVYLRASSYQQETDSHERQEGIIRPFLLANKATVAPENVFSDFRARDAAAFGKDFQALLGRVRGGQIRTVVVARLDRWGTADIDEFFKFRGILREASCKLISVEDGDLTSQEMLPIITLIIKYEQQREYLKTMASNIASGKARKAAMGHVQGGKAAPFGFDKVCFDAAGRPLWRLHFETPSRKLQFAVNPDGSPDTGKGATVWAGLRQRPPKNKTDYILLAPSLPTYGEYRCIDGDRVATVEKAFTFMAEKPWSIKRTARTLTDLGLTMYGHAITPQALQKLILNEKYKGDYAYGKTIGAKYKTCSGGQVRDVTPEKYRTGRIKRQNRTQEDWVIAAGSHIGLVEAALWQRANEQMAAKAKKRRPRSSEFYLKGLLFCTHCQKEMAARMQQRTGPNKTRVRYPGYYCPHFKDEARCFDLQRAHWIPHAEIENWLNRKLGEIGGELDTAQEVKALVELHGKYTAQDAQVNDFFAKGLRQYLDEIGAFYDAHGITDKELRHYIATAARHPDWDFTQKGLDEMYDDVRTKLQGIDARKVQAAKDLIEEKKREHKQATLAFVRAKDELTQQVIQEEVERLAGQIEALGQEAVPFLDRYQGHLTQLREFRDRLRQLVKTIEEADVDARAQRLTDAVERIELAFLPKEKWKRLRLDEEQCRVIFRDSFGTIDPSA